MSEFDLAQNFVIQFMNITRKKETMHANFKVKGSKNGTVFTTKISVELDAAGVDLTDTLDAIIAQCQERAVKEFKRAEFTSEGLAFTA